MRFAQALFAFVAMPGLVAFGIPAMWMWEAHRLQVQAPWGLAVLACGAVGLLWCVRDFYVKGRGTLAPWSPPERLVVVGLYRVSRNPMYVSVVAVLLGWAFAFASTGLLVYAAIVATAFHLRVVFGEEPWLASTHGEVWQSYVARVPRWVGRVRREG